MLNILIDSNVILDVMMVREPFFEMSKKVVALAENNLVNAYISATSVTDIYYISRRHLRDKNLVLNLIKNLRKVVKVAAVSEKEIDAALNLSWRDFEDAVQYSVAKSNEMDYIITRNTEDFSGSEVAVVTPEDFCRILLED